MEIKKSHLPGRRKRRFRRHRFDDGLRSVDDEGVVVVDITGEGVQLRKVARAVGVSRGVVAGAGSNRWRWWR